MYSQDNLRISQGYEINLTSNRRAYKKSQNIGVIFSRALTFINHYKVRAGSIILVIFKQVKEVTLTIFIALKAENK